MCMIITKNATRRLKTPKHLSYFCNGLGASVTHLFRRRSSVGVAGPTAPPGGRAVQPHPARHYDDAVDGRPTAPRSIDARPARLH